MILSYQVEKSLYLVGIFIMENEIWKDITGYEGHYQISNFGQAKSFKNEKQVILKTLFTNHGYAFVTLQNRGNRKAKPIHRLIAFAFIPNPENKPHINHINGIKTDNRIENLEWVTNRENQAHYSKLTKTSSKYLGVYFDKQTNRWRTEIKINGKRKNLGRFDTAIEASNAYKAAMKKHNIVNKYVNETEL